MEGVRGTLAAARGSRAAASLPRRPASSRETGQSRHEPGLACGGGRRSEAQQAATEKAQLAAQEKTRLAKRRAQDDAGAGAGGSKKVRTLPPAPPPGSQVVWGVCADSTLPNPPAGQGGRCGGGGRWLPGAHTGHAGWAGGPGQPEGDQPCRVAGDPAATAAWGVAAPPALLLPLPRLGGRQQP